MISLFCACTPVPVPRTDAHYRGEKFVDEAVDSGVYEVDSVNYEFESVSYTVYYIEAASVDPVVYAVGPAYPPHEGERATTYGKLLPRVSLAPGLV